MNVEIGAEAAQFPEKEYINGNAVAVDPVSNLCMTLPPVSNLCIIFQQFKNLCMTLPPVFKPKHDFFTPSFQPLHDFPPRFAISA
jgi:hypothetical protein